MVGSQFVLRSLELAQEALEAREVPVGCIYVSSERILAVGRNRVNEFCNATKHAEVVAYEKLIDSNLLNENGQFKDDNVTLYVTCEPCIMCTSMLNMINIKKVVFCCKNEKFGGCGSVLNLNSFETIFLADKEFSNDFESKAITLLQEFYKRGNPEVIKE